VPNWAEILGELQRQPSGLDVVRRRYLEKLHQKTGRNVVSYYSGFLKPPEGIPSVFNTVIAITDADKSGFMTAFHGLDRSIGLDLILHTPGGDIAATESIVDYIRSMFGTDVRAIIPETALSAGTMIACSCKSVLMGRQSSLGPVDPQLYGGVAAHHVLTMFKEAMKEVSKNPQNLPIWQNVISQWIHGYSPTLIQECRDAIALSRTLVQDWLVSGPFADEPESMRKVRAKKVATALLDLSKNHAHARHFSADKCLEIGMRIDRLEDDNELQDAVLSVHHACTHTLISTPLLKMIENHNGVGHFRFSSQS
jgi:hypothetical protein